MIELSQNDRLSKLQLSESVAASLTIRLLQRVSESDPFRDLTREEATALSAIADALSLNPAELAAKPGRRVLEFLESVLSEGPKQKDRAASAQTKLGDAGFLPLSEYDIAFTVDFSRFERLGERSRHVVEAIRQADSVQHLTYKGELATPDSFESVSLFAKRIRPAKGSAFILLVVTTRLGKRLDVIAVWRLFDEITIVPEETPLDLLQRFVEVHGVPFRVSVDGGNEFQKFVLYAVVPVSRDAAGLSLYIYTGESVPPDVIYGFPLRPGALPETSEVTLGYVINLKSYRPTLKR